MPPRWVTCEGCGQKVPEEYVECPECDGFGEEMDYEADPLTGERRRCLMCLGVGYVWEQLYGCDCPCDLEGHDAGTD